jgi:predicted DNA-binding protein
MTDNFGIDPGKLPKQMDLDLPAKLLEQLENTAAATGRSVDELILEILDRYLQEHYSS